MSRRGSVQVAEARGEFDLGCVDVFFPSESVRVNASQAAQRKLDRAPFYVRVGTILHDLAQDQVSAPAFFLIVLEFPS
jgi:hypothetical protein